MIFKTAVIAALLITTSTITISGLFACFTVNPLFIIPTLLFVAAATEVFSRLTSWYTDDV